MSKDDFESLLIFYESEKECFDSNPIISIAWKKIEKEVLMALDVADFLKADKLVEEYKYS
jgi:hypothetical protein